MSLSIHQWATIVLHPVHICPYCTSITCHMTFSCVPHLRTLGFSSIYFEHNLCAKILPCREMCQSVLMLHHLTRYYYYIHITIYKELILMITKLHAFCSPSCCTYHFDVQWAIFQWRTESLKQHRRLIGTKLAYVIFKCTENVTGKKEQYINSSPFRFSVVGG